MKITRPYDLNVSQADYRAALIWWRALSINQQKEIEKKYSTWSVPGYRQIHQIWEEEGKPQPQELIPV